MADETRRAHNHLGDVVGLRVFAEAINVYSDCQIAEG